MMLLQDLLDLVVLRDIAEPSVQLGKDDKVPLPGGGVRKEPLKLRPFGRGLSRGDTSVYIDADNLVPVGAGPLLQRGRLGLNGQAVDRLLLCADAHIQKDTFHRTPPFLF